MTLIDERRAEFVAMGRWADIPTFLLGTALFGTGLMLLVSVLIG